MLYIYMCSSAFVLPLVYILYIYACSSRGTLRRRLLQDSCVLKKKTASMRIGNLARVRVARSLTAIYDENSLKVLFFFFAFCYIVLSNFHTAIFLKFQEEIKLS